MKGLTNIQNKNNNGNIRWCLVRCLLPLKNPGKSGNADREFEKQFNFKNAKFSLPKKD